jgi:hypothetical protein
MFGAKQQAHRGTTNKRPAADAIPLGVCEFGKTRCGVSTAGLSSPLAARVALKLNMSWHNPDLYLFLSLLAGFAALLAIIYECIQVLRRRKPAVVEPRRSTVNEKAVDPPSPPMHPPSPPKNVDPPSPFSQLCESIKDLPPKEQARRMDQYFGSFGGARPTKPPFGPSPGRGRT